MYFFFLLSSIHPFLKLNVARQRYSSSVHHSSSAVSRLMHRVAPAVNPCGRAGIPSTGGAVGWVQQLLLFRATAWPCWGLLQVA